MGRTQPFIHLKPANLGASFGSRRWRFPTASGISGTNRTSRIDGARQNQASGQSESSLMLRVHLKKFPSVIGHSSSRVNRMYNEDSYSINMLKLPSLGQEMEFYRNGGIPEQENNSKKSVLNLSIFDGHGGKGRVSKLLAEYLHNAIVDSFPTQAQFYDLLLQYKNLIGGRYWERMFQNRDSFYDRFIRHCNTKQEQVLYGLDKSGSRMIFDKWGNIIDKTSLLNENERLRLYYAFLKFDLDYCCGFNDKEISPEQRLEKFPGGSTASSIFISSYDETLSFDESFFVEPNGLLKLVVTQVGDTKIILCDQNGIAHSLTKMHHANSSRETKRLKASSGFQTDSFGDTRFLNNFTNTRSFGDLTGKREGLSCEPDIYSYLIGDTMELPHSERSKLQFGGEECFICLITDGISDLASDQELTDLITSTVNMRGLKTASPQFVADEVIKYIMALGGKHADNATCLILRLSNWGNWPNIDRTGAIREEKLLAASQLDRTED